MTRGGVGQEPMVSGHSSRRGPARRPSGLVQQKEHGQELEELRAQLEAERLQTQELKRRFADETHEMKKRAEQERQLLAEKLRSKWEQERVREQQRLKEQSQRQRAAEIRQLLREKDAERCQAHELLQQQRDNSIRQARELQRQLAEELVRRGWRRTNEVRGKLQGDGKSSRRSVADVGVQVAAQEEACPPGSGDSQLLELKVQLQHAVEDL